MWDFGTNCFSQFLFLWEYLYLYVFVYDLFFQKQLAEEKARFAEAAAKRNANDDEGFSKLPSAILRVRHVGTFSCKYFEEDMLNLLSP